MRVRTLLTLFVGSLSAVSTLSASAAVTFQCRWAASSYSGFPIPTLYARTAWGPADPSYVTGVTMTTNVAGPGCDYYCNGGGFYPLFNAYPYLVEHAFWSGGYEGEYYLVSGMAGYLWNGYEYTEVIPYSECSSSGWVNKAVP